MSESSIYVIVVIVYAVVLIPDIIKLVRLIRKPNLDARLEKYFLKINSIVLFFGLVFLVILVTFEVNIFDYSAPIEYSKYKEISLKDFNGFKVPGQKLQGSNRFAFITSNIEYHYEENEIRIESLFHPARSYVYIDDMQDHELMNHEIYHFHITEIWARIFRKRLSELGSRPNKSDVRGFFKEIKASASQMQRDYDFDSDHGFLLGKQIEWQNKVDSLLKYYIKYEDTYVRF